MRLGHKGDSEARRKTKGEKTRENEGAIPKEQRQEGQAEESWV
jgi:hypothetical protein